MGSAKFSEWKKDMTETNFDGGDELLVRMESGVVHVTINRPDRRNALTVGVINKLMKVFQQADDRAVRAIVLGGSGDRAFCAGADLLDKDTPLEPDASLVSTPFADLLRAGYRCPVPVIGKINGACMAGGMGLFGICDMVIAADTARFGLPEIRIGLFPLQVLAVLFNVIPRRTLMTMCYTGEPLSAAQALGHGMVDQVVPFEDLDNATDALLAKLALGSPVAARRGKYTFRGMAHMSFDEMIAFAETQLMSSVLTQDAAEGRRAFKERRPPVWPNR
jgi:enoyl-CoA hydratase/carnithine racemase